MSGCTASSVTVSCLPTLGFWRYTVPLINRCRIGALLAHFDRDFSIDCVRAALEDLDVPPVFGHDCLRGREKGQSRAPAWISRCKTATSRGCQRRSGRPKSAKPKSLSPPYIHMGGAGRVAEPTSTCQPLFLTVSISAKPVVSAVRLDKVPNPCRNTENTLAVPVDLQCGQSTLGMLWHRRGLEVVTFYIRVCIWRVESVFRVRIKD